MHSQATGPQVAGRRYLAPEQWLLEHPGTIGRSTLYEGLRRGTIPHVRLGKRYLVPTDLLDRLLDKQMATDERAA